MGPVKISDIDFEKNCIATTSRKTKKCMASRPVSAEIMAELSKYVCGLNVGQDKLFSTKYSHNDWYKKEGHSIKSKDKLTLHCLRKSWACNLADNSVPVHTLMKLGGWSSIETCQQFYLQSTDANEKKAIESIEKLVSVA